MDTSPLSAHETLDEVTGLRRQTRRARQTFWFPLAAFGLLIVLAAPRYAGLPPAPGLADPASPSLAAPHGVVVGTIQISRHWYNVLGGFGSGTDTPSIALIWLIGVPAAYVASAAFAIWWARRCGFATRWRTYVLAGLCLFAGLAVLTWRWFTIFPTRGSELISRGLLSLIVIALGFVALALAERNLRFGLFAAGFLGLAVTANLYDLVNMVERFGIRTDGDIDVNAYICGSVLLLAGLICGIDSARPHIAAATHRASVQRRPV